MIVRGCGGGGGGGGGASITTGAGGGGGGGAHGSLADFHLVRTHSCLYVSTTGSVLPLSTLRSVSAWAGWVKSTLLISRNIRGRKRMGHLCAKEEGSLLPILVKLNRG